MSGVCWQLAFTLQIELTNWPHPSPDKYNHTGNLEVLSSWADSFIANEMFPRYVYQDCTVNSILACDL